MVIVVHGPLAKMLEAVLRLIGPLGQMHVHARATLSGQGKGTPDELFPAGEGRVEADHARNGAAALTAGVKEFDVLA